MEPKNPLQITGRYLEGIFNDRKFLRNLRMVNRVTGRTDRECYFSIHQLLFEPRYSITPIEIGSFGDGENTGMIHEDPDMHGEFIPFKDEGFDCYVLAFGHSHPINKNSYLSSYAPSLSDFSILSRFGKDDVFGGFHTRPIMILIPQVKDQKQIDLLLFQEQATPLFPDFSGEVEDLTNKLTGRLEYEENRLQKMLRGFEDSGFYRCEMMSFDGRRYERGYRRKLARFASKPAILDQEKLQSYPDSPYGP